jgi:hypothetical protein
MEIYLSVRSRQVANDAHSKFSFRSMSQAEMMFDTKFTLIYQLRPRETFLDPDPIPSTKTSLLRRLQHTIKRTIIRKLLKKTENSNNLQVRNLQPQARKPWSAHKGQLHENAQGEQHTQAAPVVSLDKEGSLQLWNLTGFCTPCVLISHP